VANPKKLHLTLAGIYERDGNQEMAGQTLKTAVRRFSQSAKVWLAHIRGAIVADGGDPDDVRKALDRATQALPKRKHVKVLVQTALLEIREGSVERGRTMVGMYESNLYA
jgi:rRNA biogenesis protein RRP5